MKKASKNKYERVKNPHNPIVRVVWTDSCSPNYGWCHITDLDIEEYMIETVGFVIDEDENSLMLTMTLSIDDVQKLHNPFTIPKCAIKFREKL